MSGLPQIADVTTSYALFGCGSLLGGAAGQGLLAKDTHGHTIRSAPPLVITSDQVEWAPERIGAILRHDVS
jgi:acetylornithine/succinyldiaminopimelate/putrescine aminotransferase